MCSFTFFFNYCFIVFLSFTWYLEVSAGDVGLLSEYIDKKEQASLMLASNPGGLKYGLVSLLHV